MLVEGRRKFPQIYRTGLYCRNTSADLQWIGTKFFHKDSSDHKSGYSIFRYILEWGNNLLLREKNDVFVLDDPLPGILELYRLFRKGFSMVISKVHKKTAPVHYSPKEHSKNLQTALKNSHSILFICYGNICRSPFAGAYLRKIVPSVIQVRSCGYYPIADRACPVEAVFAAKRYGVDLSDHRSQVINDEIIQGSDVIFIFDEKNLQTIAGEYPQIMDKVWFLSEVTQKVTVTIPDPYGKDLAIFEEVYGDIADNIKVVASLVT